MTLGDMYPTLDNRNKQHAAGASRHGNADCRYHYSSNLLRFRASTEQLSPNVTHSRRRSTYCRRRHLPSDTCPPPQKRRTRTKSSATADGPRDVMCQSKSCQLLHDSVGTSCTTNPEQIEVMELDGYSRPTCNELRASSPDALDRRRCNPQARPSTTFVDHTVDLSRRNFQSPDFRAKFQREVPLFLRYQDFLKT